MSLSVGTETEAYSESHCGSAGMLNALWILWYVIVRAGSVWQVLTSQLPSETARMQKN